MHACENGLSMYARMLIVKRLAPQSNKIRVCRIALRYVYGVGICITIWEFDEDV
jgi:hypothetical protein